MAETSLEKLRSAAERAISPIQKPTKKSSFTGGVSIYRSIPHDHYYLIFLLLVDLLGFDYVGPEEKLAYIISVEHDGKRYDVIYAKFGMKIEYQKGGNPKKVFELLKKGISSAKRYYEWRAEQAAETSDLNLVAQSIKLWEKYSFLRERSIELFEEAETRKDESHREEFESEDGLTGWSVSFPAYRIRAEAEWHCEAAVDAFFAWSEHSLVHIAILLRKVTTGTQVTELIRGEWAKKCKACFDLDDPEDKRVYDDISKLKNDLRNFVAHGSFGKDGAMFTFHTAVGAIPLRALDPASRRRFAFGNSSPASGETDYERIDRFVEQLWSGYRKPAKKYIESGLPTILTYSVNGFYENAMQSEGSMEEFVEHLGYQVDNAANMDF